MRRIFHEYEESIRDITILKLRLSDNTLTESTDENTIANNQFYYKFDNYITFKSDGTKKVGVVFDLKDKLINGDFLKASVELMSIDGDRPSLVYFEGATNYVLNKPSLQEGFEFVSGEFYITDRTGLREGKVFIGLDIGQSGTFRMRFPIVKHFAQIEYSPTKQKRKTKMFQLAKNSGSWVVETTNSYRLLDGATVTSTGNSMYITFTTPFIVDVPQVFVQTNTSMGGYTVHFGFRGKDQMILTVFQGTTQVSWTTIPDGAVMNIMAIAGLYY